MQQQLATKGEYFWIRQWQVVGANCCLKHGQLLETNLASHHRHQFFSANPDLCPKADQLEGNLHARRVARQVNILLAMAPEISANFAQWSQYYSQLARQVGLKQGHHIRHEGVKDRVLERWPVSWLKQHGLMLNDNQTCWLRTIFGKHRKSLSYLEHIVILDSFLPEQWCIDEVIAKVAAMQVSKDHISTILSLPSNAPISVLTVYRKHWLEMVKQYSAKLARKNGGGAVYLDCTMAARPSKPRRISVMPAAIQTCVPAGKPIMCAGHR
jgi:hypothetical protein